MKLAVDFPSIAFREGPAAVAQLATEIERIGYDQLDMFDHVVMGFPIEGRTGLQYPAKMPILEALVTLGYCAAVTSRIGLGTEVLVLPQRQPVLVAKQISTLDTLSGGRVRLGVGVGWQESEYDALGESFNDRGKRMDEALRVLRACWRDERVDFAGDYYQITAMGMEPKPPQGATLADLGRRAFAGRVAPRRPIRGRLAGRIRKQQGTRHKRDAHDTRACGDASDEIPAPCSFRQCSRRRRAKTTMVRGAASTRMPTVLRNAPPKSPNWVLAGCR